MINAKFVSFARNLPSSCDNWHKGRCQGPLSFHACDSDCTPSGPQYTQQQSMMPSVPSENEQAAVIIFILPYAQICKKYHCQKHANWVMKFHCRKQGIHEIKLGVN